MQKSNIYQPANGRLLLGTAELVKWYAYNGELTEGVLYKPENFDPNKKYPMLAVFMSVIPSSCISTTPWNPHGAGLIIHSM